MGLGALVSADVFWLFMFLVCYVIFVCFFVRSNFVQYRVRIVFAETNGTKTCRKVVTSETVTVRIVAPSCCLLQRRHTRPT